MFAELLISRTRTILWISLVVGLAFTAVELATVSRLAAPFYVKCFGLSCTILALVMLRRPWMIRHALAVSLAVIIAGYALTALSGMVSPSREYETTAVLFVGAALVTATLLPWGMWPQLLTVLLASGLLADAALRAGAGAEIVAADPAVVDPAAAVVLTLLLSVVTAYEVQRHRLASLRELAARQWAEDELRAFAADLERRVTERTQELATANAQLHRLSARVEAVREEERRRVAREIHDDLGQLLTALKIDLDLLPKRIGDRGDGADVTSVQRHLGAMSELAGTMIRSVRRISAELRPSVLDDLGLVAALEWQARDFQARCGIDCTVVCGERQLRLDPMHATMLFRIVEEALANAARHARAKHIAITLGRDGDGLLLEVRDDGRGVTDAELHGRQALGVLGIRERTRLLGGELDIRGVPGGGTTVQVRLPLHETLRHHPNPMLRSSVARLP